MKVSQSQSLSDSPVFTHNRVRRKYTETMQKTLAGISDLGYDCVLQIT